jgi:trans-aconitate methyltransferase
LTNEIKKRGAEVTGLDASDEMVERAQKAYPDIDFKVANAANFHLNKAFDAVFSNATLHWIHNADDVIKCVYDSLRHGGRFVAEMGGKGNMELLIAAAQQVLTKYGYKKLGEKKLWYFPSIGEYASKLEARGFKVIYAIHFDRPTLLQDGKQGVGKWLNMFGPNFFEEIEQTEKQQIITEITDLLEPAYNQDGNWYADYKRLRFVAVKE